MVDVHCHLNFKSFSQDYDSVIKDAFEKGVGKIINVGTQIVSSEKAIELAEKYENLYAIVGVHPHHADKVESDWDKKLEEIVLQSRISLSETKNPKVVGIGECGMDFYRYNSNGIVEPKLQEEVFTKQIELSQKLKLPLQIHNRQAGKEILEILKYYKNDLLSPPGMFHCMSGDLNFLKSVLDLGFYTGYDGNITYRGIAPGETTSLSDLVKQTPLERIVTETDAPYLTPEPHRGSRNIPSYVIITGRFIAETKGLDFDEVKAQTTQNANKIFNFPK
jgi:TatD DNase family protein